MSESLLSKRLLIVTGKGGAGKSTVCAALALSAARRGLRVLACEAGVRERLAPLLGGPPETSGLEAVASGVHCLHVRPTDALHEYALTKLKVEAVYRAVFENPLMQAFLRLVPSLNETVILGKVRHEVEARLPDGRQRWDLVLLDAPASGHVVSFLRVPRTLIATVPPGPLRADAQRIQSLLCDPSRTSVQLVTLPEELPVSETLELHSQLTDLELPLGRIFLNAFVPARFSPEEVAQLEDRTRDTPRVGPLTAAAAAAWAGRFQARQSDRSASYQERLRRDVADMPLVTLPRIYSAGWGLAQVEALSRLLDEEPS